MRVVLSILMFALAAADVTDYSCMCRVAFWDAQGIRTFAEIDGGVVQAPADDCPVEAEAKCKEPCKAEFRKQAAQLANTACTAFPHKKRDAVLVIVTVKQKPCVPLLATLNSTTFLCEDGKPTAFQPLTLENMADTFNS